MVVGGRTLELHKVKIPIYNLATREDHIAPAKSVFLGSKFFGGPLRYVLSGSGQIAGVINPPAAQKYGYWIGGPPEGTLDQWIQKAEQHSGSWWPDWLKWIKDQDPTEVPARAPGGGKFSPIEDAPGSYVKVRDLPTRARPSPVGARFCRCDVRCLDKSTGAAWYWIDLRDTQA